MSGFKIASLATDEDEDAVKSAKLDGSQKLCDEIFQSSVQEDDEERQKALVEIYLGPRSTKTVLRGEENETMRKRGSQFEESCQEMSDTDDRSDPKTPPKEKDNEGKVKGFNDGDIRRFIKAYKKFPLPHTRMSDIALDADLTEKPVANLADLTLGPVNNGSNELLVPALDLATFTKCKEKMRNVEMKALDMRGHDQTQEEQVTHHL